REVTAHVTVRLSHWLMDHVGPPGFRNTHTLGLRSLVDREVRLAVYTSMLQLSATRRAAGRAPWAISGHLPPDGFWWTRSEEGRELEAAILGRNGREQTDIPLRLAALHTGFEEWRALQREYLLVQAQNGPDRPAGNEPAHGRTSD